MVVAAQDADVGPRPSRPAPIGPAPVVLHVEPSGRGRVTGDLVDTLTEFRIGIGREPGADALVRRREGLAAILAQVVAARGDAQV